VNKAAPSAPKLNIVLMLLNNNLYSK